MDLSFHSYHGLSTGYGVVSFVQDIQILEFKLIAKLNGLQIDN